METSFMMDYSWFEPTHAKFLASFSFWFATAVMLASTVFFLVERNDVPTKWKTSLTVASLVTGIAFWHYLYMSDMFLVGKQSPLALRYVDWFITVPLQIVEFYLILAAVTVVSRGLFWQLLIASVVMLLGGFVGEAYPESFGWPGFIVGMLGWIYVLYLIFAGPASNVSQNSGSEASQKAFKALRLIVLVGWSIYPIGYYVNIDGGASDMTNIIYNFADLINKSVFGLFIWAAAKSDSEK